MKAQVSLELLITIGVVLAFTVPVVLLLFTTSQIGYESASVSQANAAAKTLADNINEIALQGEGARKIMLVSFPSSMTDFTVEANEVVVKMKTTSGDYHAISPIFVNAKVNPASFTGKAGLLRVRMTTTKETDGRIGVEID